MRKLDTEKYFEDPVTELQELRYRYCLKLEALAEASGLNRTTIWAYEVGKNKFTEKGLSCLVAGYRRLGYDNAKYALADIFQRRNPKVIKYIPPVEQTFSGPLPVGNKTI